jgi:hypothetical protein
MKFILLVWKAQKQQHDFCSEINEKYLTTPDGLGAQAST